MDKQFQWKEYFKLLQIFDATAIMHHTTTKWLCSVEWILFSNCKSVEGFFCCCLCCFWFCFFSLSFTEYQLKRLRDHFVLDKVSCQTKTNYCDFFYFIISSKTIFTSTSSLWSSSWTIYSGHCKDWVSKKPKYCVWSAAKLWPIIKQNNK